MKAVIGLALAASVVLFSGCASQKPVKLSMDAWSSQSVKVGVVMGTVPKPDTQFPGANCLLCIAAANVAHVTLTNYTNTLAADDLETLPADIAARLRARGIDAKAIDERIAINKLPTLSRATDQADHDFTSIGTKYGVDKLVVIEIALLGFERAYSSFVPASDPKGFITGRGYLVDLKTQKYEWYDNLRILRASEGSWDEPPKYPGLTNAYFQAIESSKDQFVKVFQGKKP
jgi:hypothetical protein